jgi:hypothetical protein
MLKYASSDAGTTTLVTRPIGHVMKTTRTADIAVRDA